MGFFRDWVMPARVKRMAATNTLDGKPAARQRPKARDCLHRVFRAAGRETAPRPQQRTDEALVKPQEENEQTADHARMICELRDDFSEAEVAAPDAVGYKDAPFPDLGS